MSSCIFLNICNEENYIGEFVYYHLLIGFDHIYIYDTSNNYSMKNSMLNRNLKVTIIHKPLNGRDFNRVQCENMTEFNNEYKLKYKWCAMIDCDEFIVLKKHSSINEFLNSINLNSGCLGINWKLFGTNGHKKYEQIPVINRFTKCGNYLDQHIKSISIMEDVDFYNNPHFPILKSGKQINEKNKIYPMGAFHTNSTNDLIQINHYVTKSVEEYDKRNSNHHTRLTNKQFFINHDRNDENDFDAYNILNKIIKHSDINSFDYTYYIQTNYDLILNCVITKELAEEHYNYEGIKEKRLCNFNFDFEDYKNKNKDLQNSTNIEIWNHFKFNNQK